jgi:hypothetical protein
MLLPAAGWLALPAMGQEPTPQAPQKKVTIVHTHDGGVTEVLQSIVVPPKAGAPFTLTLETEWVKQLYDGGTTTLVMNEGSKFALRLTSIRSARRPWDQ